MLLTLDSILSENQPPYSPEAYLKNAVQLSPFLEKIVRKHPDLMHDLLSNVAQPYTLQAMQATLPKQNNVDETALKRVLRHLRRHVIARIIVRDLNGLADLSEVMLTTSLLADVSIKTAIKSIEASLSSVYGNPSASESDASQPQSLMVVGMGKLGGYELNVSSDIDLIFTYESAGETDGEKSISNQEFFTKVSQRLISAIDDVTEDGFVFRVDMRLRPFGSEGALVCSLSALENYYQTYGREWERYAWIKARVITGDGALVKALLLPFVFRRYLDFGSLDNMRALKAQIQADVNRRELHDNIKLGRGGIREIEFIAQVFQLMRGGQEQTLQVRPTLTALNNLTKLGLMSEKVQQALAKAYTFLRNLEHRLQYYNDAQTHDLPSNDAHRAVIAKSMDFPSWEALVVALSDIRDYVTSQFDVVFVNDDVTSKNEAGVIDCWAVAHSEADVITQLSALGYADSDDAHRRIVAFKRSHRLNQLPDVSRQRLDDLMPVIIALSAQHDNAEDTLQRMISLIETICRRASYLAFFAEFPQILDRLVAIVSASPWIATYLSHHPILLDTLSKRQAIDHIDYTELEAQISDKLQWLDGDVEQQMNVLREFQQMQLFALASQDVIERIPLQKLSGELSQLADMILRVVIKTLWPTIKGRHCDVPKFAIIAYGKHGGFELGYSSDLDMVFLYQDDHPDAREIYSRFGMRIISWLNTMTSSGILYETDMELRPNGASGLLVTSIEGFRTYQFESAWVWEHQAITRARFAVGDAATGDAFEKVRHDVLVMPRDEIKLKCDVIEMRKKMKAAYHYKIGEFDLKKSFGGMIDIEFIVQYLVLANAKQYPALIENSGNIKILTLCAEYGLVPADLATEVGRAYITLRSKMHAMRLQGVIDAKVEEASMASIVSVVRALWKIVFINDN